jgi:hypothetical protein
MGDAVAARRFAQQALESDTYAYAERAAGRVAKRSNVSGNAWHAWYRSLTGLSSGWE